MVSTTCTFKTLCMTQVIFKLSKFLTYSLVRNQMYCSWDHTGLIMINDTEQHNWDYHCSRYHVALLSFLSHLPSLVSLNTSTSTASSLTTTFILFSSFHIAICPLKLSVLILCLIRGSSLTHCLSPCAHCVRKHTDTCMHTYWVRPWG